MDARKLTAEFLGTALLVFFAVGVATASFGFRFFGSSPSAGVVTTAFAFGLVLLALIYAFGPISGCHVNPAVTIGFVVSNRMTVSEALGYVVAQLAGGIAGAVGLWAVYNDSSFYSRKPVRLAARAWGK